MADPPTSTRRSRPHHRWLLVLPFVWQVGLTPAVNDVAFHPLSIPFPMLWQMLGVVFTTLIIGLVFYLDRRRGMEAGEPAGADSLDTVAGSADGGHL